MNRLLGTIGIVLAGALLAPLVIPLAIREWWRIR